MRSRDIGDPKNENKLSEDWQHMVYVVEKVVGMSPFIILIYILFHEKKYLIFYKVK